MRRIRVIVVIGTLAGRPVAGGWQPAGTTALTAIRAAEAGSVVQVVGRIGDDEVGDAVLVALARSGVGHVAVLRDPSRATPVLGGTVLEEDVEPPPDVRPPSPPPDSGPVPALDAADVELALRYVPDFRCLVLAEPLDDGVVTVAADAARYSSAELVVVARGTWPAGVPAGALVLEPPDADPEGAFSGLLGNVAAAVDGGAAPAVALDEVAARLGAVRPAS
jgi:hypothetical protein